MGEEGGRVSVSCDLTVHLLRWMVATTPPNQHRNTRSVKIKPLHRAHADKQVIFLYFSHCTPQPETFDQASSRWEGRGSGSGGGVGCTASRRRWLGGEGGGRRVSFVQQDAPAGSLVKASLVSLRRTVWRKTSCKAPQTCKAG